MASEPTSKVTGHERLTMKTEHAPTSAPVDRLVGRNERLKFFADVEGDIDDQASVEQVSAWDRLGRAIDVYLPFKPSVGDELQITVDETLFVFEITRVRLGVSMGDDGVIEDNNDQQELVLNLIDCV